MAAERQLPALKDHLVLNGSSAAPDGYIPRLYEPIYGWAAAPRYTGLRRLSPNTPMQGLVLTGQWTRPGQGTIGVILSGRETARNLLE